MAPPNRVLVIGSGFAGLSAACFLAQKGIAVTVLEKHDRPGGRARQFSAQGFTFDMGPSWYWMPDVFERFFSQFGKRPADYYHLQRLDPSYQVFWSKESLDIPADYASLRSLFESIEPGSGPHLDRYLRGAAYKYRVGMTKLVFKPGLSLWELFDAQVIAGAFRLNLFASIKTHIAGYFKDTRLRQLLEFPVLFLGALPEDIPALYSLMNYADICLGTWYPNGGIYKVIEAMYDLGRSLGVQFEFEQEVKQIEVQQHRAVRAHTPGSVYEFDAVIGAADYHHIETSLLETQYQSYSSQYWESRVLAPSSLLFYLGLNKKLNGIRHHSLFFDVDFDLHAKAIYADPHWPEDPLFYVSCTSVSDPTVAPPGHENLFILIPLATGLEDDSETRRQAYLDSVLERLESRLGQTIREHIVFRRSYAGREFINDYHAYKGNAYGLANTLWQTANLKPSIRSKKVQNLYFTGQLTLPGPGVPPSLISGELVAKQLMADCFS